VEHLRYRLIIKIVADPREGSKSLPGEYTLAYLPVVNVKKLFSFITDAEA